MKLQTSYINSNLQLHNTSIVIIIIIGCTPSESTCNYTAKKNEIGEAKDAFSWQLRIDTRYVSLTFQCSCTVGQNYTCQFIGVPKQGIGYKYFNGLNNATLTLA